jgi:16S rRNA (uracil1498-N3)-methyltransferase
MNDKEIRRFYLRSEFIFSDTEDLLLSGKEAHHISNVLRLGHGEEIFLMDGQGNRAKCIVEKKEKGRLFLRILTRETLQDDRIPIHLIIAVIKGDRMNWLLQKAAELGVLSIRPVIASHTIMSLHGISKENRMDRWQEIAIQALKQCRGNWATEILPLSSLKEAAQNCPKESAKIFLSEKERKTNIFSTWQSQKQKTPIMLAVGPEGGFSEDEREFLEEEGFHPVTLGPRILRSETAAIAGIAIFSMCLKGTG